MNISKILPAWPIVETGPWQFSPLRRGTNNRSWRVEATDGRAYVLRLPPNGTNLARIRYEAALLRALSDQRLPFALPLPLEASNGDVIVSFEQEDGTSGFATLTPFLPGKAPDRNDLTRVAPAGAALAVLDAALAALPEIADLEQSRPFSTFGNLTHVHALVPDPLAALARLPVAPELSERVSAWLATVMARVDELYRELPQQLLHCDYDPGNILMDDAGVSAVLDFEFAGRDIRVLDLCVALSWWPVNLMETGTGKEWAIIDAFGEAYVRDFPLSEAELRAIPAVLRLRDATSLVHRVGRYLAGLESDEVIVDRLKFTLWREHWLLDNEEMLMKHVLAWRG